MADRARSVERDGKSPRGKRRANACSVPNSLYLQAILLALPIDLAP
jgi:hypothetical protein